MAISMETSSATFEGAVTPSHLSETSSAYEQTLLSVKECFVYKVPPLRAASGHRAEEWGLEKPLFTGHLKIFQNDVKLRITLYRYKDESTLLATPENLIQFADCPFQITPGEDVTAFVDSVADSSRYFVLRIKDPNSNRTAFLGIGFRERDTAFDFKNALNEYVRYVDRMNTAEQMAREMENIGIEDESRQSLDEHTPPSLCVHKDLSLKEGEKIHVNVKTSKKHSSSSSASSKPSSTGGLLLRPPPPAGSIVKPTVQPTVAMPTEGHRDQGEDNAATQAGEVTADGENDDFAWGDFTSS